MGSMGQSLLIEPAICMIFSTVYCPLVLVEATLGQWRLHIICDYVPLGRHFLFSFYLLSSFPCSTYPVSLTNPSLLPHPLSAGVIEVSHCLQRRRLFTNQQYFNKGLAVSRKLTQ